MNNPNRLKILFITHEHPGMLYGGLGTFTRDYLHELKKHCEVRAVFLNIRKASIPVDSKSHGIDFVITPEYAYEAKAPESVQLEAAASVFAQVRPLLEIFKPDVIHCNDRQTILPFRYEKNVLYSSHLLYSDLLGLQGVNDSNLPDIKIERCAVRRSAIVAVYSQFAAERLIQMAGSEAAPVILPLGIHAPHSRSRKKNNEKFRIAYFGRLDSLQKGLARFIAAVEALGREYLHRKGVVIAIHGKGVLPPGVDSSLFETVDFLEGDELQEAYESTDVVVMPSLYEPFGLVGLEAMAAGCLLLATSGLGMDEYARGGETCVSISTDPLSLSQSLRCVIEEPSAFEKIRLAGQAAARTWTWERSVAAHMEIYRRIARGECGLLKAASRSETLTVKKRKQQSPLSLREEVDVAYRKGLEGLDFSKGNRNAIFSSINLPLGPLPSSWEVIQFEGLNSLGMRHALECLPYAEESFDFILLLGPWDSVSDPAAAISECLRVAREELLIFSWNGERLPWQTIMMEGEKDWMVMAREVGAVLKSHSLCSGGKIAMSRIHLDHRKKERIHDLHKVLA